LRPGVQVPRTVSDLLTLLDCVTSPSIVATADKAGRLAGMLQEAFEDTTMDCESVMPKILKRLRSKIEEVCTACDPSDTDVHPAVAEDNDEAGSSSRLFTTMQHHASLRLFAAMTLAAVRRHTASFAAAVCSPATRACTALVPTLVKVLDAYKNQNDITGDSYLASVNCAEVLACMAGAHAPIYHPVLLANNVLPAVVHAACVVKTAFKLSPFHNTRHRIMLQASVTMIQAFGKATTELHPSLFTTLKKLLDVVRLSHADCAAVAGQVFACCNALLPRLLDQEATRAPVFHEHFDGFISPLVFIATTRGFPMQAPTASMLADIIRAAVASRCCTEVLELIVQALATAQLAGDNPYGCRSEISVLFLKGFADTTPQLEQLSAVATQRFLRWFAGVSPAILLEYCHLGGPTMRLVTGFVPVVIGLMRKHSPNTSVAALCCQALLPFVDKYAGVVDLSVTAPAAAAIASVLDAAGWCQPPVVPDDLDCQDYSDLFLSNCCLVLEYLAVQERSRPIAATEPSVCLVAVKSLCSMVVRMCTAGVVIDAIDDLRCILRFFDLLSMNPANHAALKSCDLGFLLGFTQLLDMMAIMPHRAVDHLAEVARGMCMCLWHLYSSTECFGAEDARCLTAASHMLDYMRLGFPRAEFMAKVQQAQAQQRRWTGLRMGWVGAVGQHQGALHDTLRAAELELQAAQEEAEEAGTSDGSEEDTADDTEEEDVVPARKLVRRA
jgi:hypothetical protein